MAALGARFLLVFLRGGYDSNNALIPYSSSFYYEARPTLAIARPQAGAGSSDPGALELDAAWALARLTPQHERGEILARLRYHAGPEVHAEVRIELDAAIARLSDSEEA